MLEKTMMGDGIGFVALERAWGDDLEIVNDARISFAKRSYEFSEGDERLLKWLWKHEHTSPFRHSFLKYTIKMPIYLARQWMKHVVGCSWNEASGRYIPIDSWFCPDVFREAPENLKQGSGGDLSIELNKEAKFIYQEAAKHSFDAYDRLIELGVCREQARGVLPVASYTLCRWTASFQAVLNFLLLREKGEKSQSQKEIHEYAEAVKKMSEPYFQKAFEAYEAKIGL